MVTAGTLPRSVLLSDNVYEGCGARSGPAASLGLFPRLRDGRPPHHVPPALWRGKGRVSLSWSVPETCLRRSAPVSRA